MTTEHQAWTDKLSDYLDDELSLDERYAVESHLQGCAACAAVLEDLKRVVARARDLPPRPPQSDLWTGISERLNQGGTGSRVATFRTAASRRFAFTMPQLAAASLLIAAASGALVWTASRSIAPRADLLGPPAVGAASSSATQKGSAYNETMPPARDPDGVSSTTLEPVGLADKQYDAAVADLERALRQGRGHLDSATIAAVELNLQTIDEAIRQAREALAADPANTFLNGHLVEARRRKLDLLRRATDLTTEMD